MVNTDQVQEMEQGQMDGKTMLKVFQTLIKDKMLDRLDDNFEKVAKVLIKNKICYINANDN